MDIRKIVRWSQTGVVLLLVQIVTCYGYANKSISACFNTQKTIQLECDTGYMVRIIQTFYGYSHTGKCTFKDGDCNLAEQEHYTCIGKQRCEINLPSGNLGKKIPGCNKRSTYFQADYQCIKASDVVDICAVSEVTSQSGYISTPHYPRNYPNNKKCTLTIRGRPTQTWTIYSLDVYLPGVSQKGCDDQLYIFDSYKPTTLCGNRWNDRIFTSYIKNASLELTFKSDAKGQMKGFWLYFEANPLLATPVPPTVTSTTTEREDTTRPSSGGQGNSSPGATGGDDNIVKEKHGSGLPYPAAAIIGGVIGGLLLILAVLIVLLLVKRIREHKQLKASRSDLNTKRKISNSQNLQIQNNVASIQNENNPSYNPYSNNTSNNPCYNAQYEGINVDNSQTVYSDRPGVIMC